MQAKVTRENAILWLSLFFGVLLVPFAVLGIIALFSAFLVEPPDIPRTAEQWRGFLTAIAVIAGAIAGLTVRSRHSMRRRIIHLLFAVQGIIWLVVAMFL